MNNTIILPEKLTRSITIETNLDPKAFVHIPETNKFISKRVGYQGQDFYGTVQTVETTSAYVIAPPSIFMPHYARVCRAAVEKDITLHDGTGEPLERKAINDLYEYLSTEAWAWLDAYFEKTEQGLYLATDHRLVEGKLQPQTQQPLETCVMKDCVVDLMFNRQGLPMRQSEKQAYQRGKNLRYWFPRDGAVAGFIADRGCADLHCLRYPRNSNPAFGVLLCAEGAAKK